MAMSNPVRTNHVITRTCDYWWEVKSILSDTQKTNVAIAYDGQQWSVSIVIDKDDRDGYDYLLDDEEGDVA